MSALDSKAGSPLRRHDEDVSIIPGAGQLLVEREALLLHEAGAYLALSGFEIAQREFGIDIHHFQADYAGAATPSAVIEVSAKLLHSHDQTVVGSRTFRQQRPAAGTDVTLVADAFSQALSAASRDIAGWVLVAGQAHERKHPSGTH